LQEELDAYDRLNRENEEKIQKMGQKYEELINYA
jgi:hypothetical protein